MKTLRLIGFFIVLASATEAQNPVTFTTKEPVLWAGVDRPGDLFLVFPSGEIQKLDPAGKLLAKHVFKTAPTLFEAGDGVTSACYMRKENRYFRLSSELMVSVEFTIDPAFAVTPWLACPSSLHEIWIFDSGDFTLKKTKSMRSTIALEMPLEKLSRRNLEDYPYMREYQNLLFVLDKKVGIHLFSSLGKYVRTIGEGGITNFNFLGEELYYRKGNTIILIDLYSEDQRSLGIPQSCEIVLLTDTKLFAVEKNKVSVYDFKP